MTALDIEEHLFRSLQGLEPVPTSHLGTPLCVCLSPQTPRLKRTAFFPGGYGLTDGAKKRDSIKVIVVGLDFGNYDSFVAETQCEKQDEMMVATWRNMPLNAAGISHDICWFTNAWPVLRAGNVKETGDHDMHEAGPFTDRCRNFLVRSIEDFQPRLVVALGKGPSWMIGSAYHIWNADGGRDFNHLKSSDFDEEPIAVRNGRTFVAATHPSMPNHRYRVHGTREAEVELLRTAYTTAGPKEAGEKD